MSWKTAPDQSARAVAGQWSLATRLTVWYAGWAFLLMVVATGLLYWVVVQTLDEEDKQDVAAQIRDLEQTLKTRPLDVAVLRQEVENETSPPTFAPNFVRVLDRNGHQLAETPGMSATLPASAFPTQPVASVRHGRLASLRSATGRQFGALTVVVENDYLVQVAVDEAGDVKLLSACRQRLALVLGCGLILSAFMGHTIASRGVRPVREIAATVQRIRATTLNARIEFSRLPAELHTLVITFNEVLDHLQDAFSRLSQFSANIAHELRTPINNLRGEAEVALSKARSPEEYREVLSSCLEECARLSRLIDSLLLLARAEDLKTQINRERVDVARELQILHDFYDPTAGEAGVALRVESPTALAAELDRTLFQRAVGNLIENALTHSERGGTVTLAATTEDNTVRVVVSDTGRGIPADQLPGMFERFRRGDESRAKDSGGQGLGLAIVKSIVTLHQGTVEIASQVGRGTQVTLRLPLISKSALSISGK